MRHTEVRERLSEYLEREMSIEQRALIDAHLDECDACHGELESLRRTVESLQALSEIDEPASIASRVMVRIEAGEARPTLLSRLLGTLDAWTQPGRIVAVVAVASAAAAMAILRPELLPETLFGRAETPIVAYGESRLVQIPFGAVTAPAGVRRLLGASRAPAALADDETPAAPQFAPLPVVQAAIREPRALLELAWRIRSVEERERWVHEQARLAQRLGIAHQVAQRLREVPEPAANDIRGPFEQAAFESGGR